MPGSAQERNDVLKFHAFFQGMFAKTTLLKVPENYQKNLSYQLELSNLPHIDLLKTAQTPPQMFPMSLTRIFKIGERVSMVESPFRKRNFCTLIPFREVYHVD